MSKMAAASRTVLIAVDASEHSRQAFECEYRGLTSPVRVLSHVLFLIVITRATSI